MRYPPEHYPSEGLQHAYATLALNAVFTFLEYKEAARHAPQAAKITRWAAECAIETKERRLLREGRVRVEAAWRHAYKFTPKKADAFYHWGVLGWAALTLVEDVRTACPAFGRGKKRAAWRYLWQTMTTLVDTLCASFSGLDEDGTALYEEMSWALDGRSYWRAA